MRSRPALEALVCVVAGAIISQAWAYTCYFRATPTFLGDNALPNGDLRVPSFLHGRWTEPDQGTFEAGLSLTNGIWGAGRTSTTLRCPAPPPSQPPPGYWDDPARYGLYTDSFGWPMRSLVRYRECVLMSGGNGNHIDVSAFFKDFEHVAGLRRGVEKINFGSTCWEPPKNKALGAALPVWPLCGGLVGNTLLYGLLAWLAMFAPGRMRRAIRRRAGRCVRCGYDLRGLAAATACPECGPVAPRPPRVRIVA